MAEQIAQIHIVGDVDVKDGAGRFLYVTPSTVPATVGASEAAAGPRLAPPPGSGFEILVEDAEGKELQRLRPRVLRPSDAADSTGGLIDQRIVPTQGMARLKLLYDNRVVDTFEAGAPHKAQPKAQAALSGVALGAVPGQPAKQLLDLKHYGEEAGISYTVQVRPQGDHLWQTLAVGRPTPDVMIDSNQFPGAQSATVRVLRSTGFDDAVIAEGEVDLTYTDQTPLRHS